MINYSYSYSDVGCCLPIINDCEQRDGVRQCLSRVSTVLPASGPCALTGPSADLALCDFVARGIPLSNFVPMPGSPGDRAVLDSHGNIVWQSTGKDASEYYFTNSDGVITERNNVYASGVHFPTRRTLPYGGPGGEIEHRVARLKGPITKYAKHQVCSLSFDGRCRGYHPHTGQPCNRIHWCDPKDADPGFYIPTALYKFQELVNSKLECPGGLVVPDDMYETLLERVRTIADQETLHDWFYRYGKPESECPGLYHNRAREFGDDYICTPPVFSRRSQDKGDVSKLHKNYLRDSHRPGRLFCSEFQSGNCSYKGNCYKVHPHTRPEHPGHVEGNVDDNCIAKVCGYWLADHEGAGTIGDGCPHGANCRQDHRLDGALLDSRRRDGRGVSKPHDSLGPLSLLPHSQKIAAFRSFGWSSVRWFSSAAVYAARCY